MASPDPWGTSQKASHQPRALGDPARAHGGGQAPVHAAALRGVLGDLPGGEGELPESASDRSSWPAARDGTGSARGETWALGCFGMLREGSCPHSAWSFLCFGREVPLKQGIDEFGREATKCFPLGARSLHLGFAFMGFS